MKLRKYTKLIVLLLLAPALLAQQANGRNYTRPLYLVGNSTQWGNDDGVNGYALTTPLVTGPLPAIAWGLFHAYEAAADTAGTNHHGLALYSSGGTLLCSVYTARTVAVGDNAYSLPGCGVPAANTAYTLAYLTDWGGDEPGSNSQAAISSFNCPGTASSSGYVAESSFPSALPATSGQSFCYSFYAEEILAGGSNGKYFGRNAGVNRQTAGVPTGPWSAGGSYFGGLNSAATFVSFSDGLVNATYPTTAALNNSTHGTACTWTLASSSTVIAGSSAGHANLITPVAIGSSTYSGYSATPVTYVYNTGATRNYVICTMPTTYTAMSVGFHLKTDIPITDPINNQYDAGGIESGDGIDQFSLSIMAGGASLELVVACEIGGTSAGNPANAIPIVTNGNYYLELLKLSGGATQTMYVFNQDKGGAYVGQTTCAADTGTHLAGYFFTPINGGETNTSGLHVWADTYEANITGAFLAP